MQVTLLEVFEKADKNGEFKHSMNVLGTFSSYGVNKMKAVDVTLTADEYAIYSPKIGQKIEIDVVVPLPDFPLKLVQKENKK